MGPSVSRATGKKSWIRLSALYLVAFAAISAALAGASGSGALWDVGIIYSSIHLFTDYDPDLHHGADRLPVGENLTQCLGAEDVTQRRLRQQLCRPCRVLDVDDRNPRV